MIFDDLTHAALYFPLHPGVRRALEFLQSADLRSLSEGRHDVDGDRVFALVQEYVTKPRAEGRFEAHRVHWDVQYVVFGAETMGVGRLEDMTVTEPYVEKSDIAFFDGPGSFVALPAGRFAILAPQDAHMPGLAVDAPARVRKVVVKVRWEG